MAFVKDQDPREAIQEFYAYLQGWRETQEKVFRAREDDLIRREEQLAAEKSKLYGDAT